MATEETVLCIHQDRLPAAWMQQIAVIPMDLADFVRHGTQAGYEFVPRSLAETSPQWQQVIPYIVLQTADQQHTAVYHRKGSETRLHDLWSLGIGGHINPQDRADAAAAFETIVISGMTRELDEELSVRPAGDAPVFCGIINETVTEVGRVHLGAVFRISTASPGAYVPGPELNRFHWIATEMLPSLTLELWSTLALDLLGRGR